MASALKDAVHKKTLLLLLAFAIGFDFTGCVSMSPQARRERAYRHYVAKQMKKRQKEMARAQKAANREMKLKMKNVQPSEPHVTTSVQEVSEYPSVFQPVAESQPQPSSQVASEPAPAFKEPTVDPITVSASSTFPAESDSAPQQP
ncbi:MAG TPA: hypothetical protein VH170_01320 [Chthoniobacterales bacterium]|nr:hypothetical protein [Chthoniobacterales bacterium]